MLEPPLPRITLKETIRGKLNICQSAIILYSGRTVQPTKAAVVQLSVAIEVQMRVST